MRKPDKIYDCLVILILVIAISIIPLGYFTSKEPKRENKVHFIPLVNYDLTNIQSKVNRIILDSNYKQGDSIVFVSTIPDDEYINNLLDVCKDDDSTITSR